ncbi:hypothetical protein FSP39_016958 [Pinctada imbricata]|uniref:Uncharacterized protein n=1 Tax=Pinctada imbricata TaxID=66713 RepID=A0AA88XJ82_PINIB|nr:hypothetical protein FSP39_016958 [Pinctada imbricata]
MYNHLHFSYNFVLLVNRDILISRQVIGHIPYITFVKDKTQAYLEQVDRLLERADYGPGYTPGKWKTAYFSDPSALNNEEGTLDEEEQGPAPDFSYVNNDIYGLDHDAIAKRLQTSIRKIKNRTKNSDGEIPPEKEVVKKPEFIKSTLRKNFQKKKTKRLEKLSKGFGFSEFERDGFSDLSDYDHDDTGRFDYDEKDYYDDSQYDVNVDNYEDPEDVR